MFVNRSKFESSLPCQDVTEKFGLALTRYRHNLKIVGKLMVVNSLQAPQDLMQKEYTYTLSVEKGQWSKVVPQERGSILKRHRMKSRKYNLHSAKKWQALSAI